MEEVEAMKVEAKRIEKDAYQDDLVHRRMGCVELGLNVTILVLAAAAAIGALWPVPSVDKVATVLLLVVGAVNTAFGLDHRSHTRVAYQDRNKTLREAARRFYSVEADSSKAQTEKTAAYRGVVQMSQRQGTPGWVAGLLFAAAAKKDADKAWASGTGLAAANKEAGSE